MSDATPIEGTRVYLITEAADRLEIPRNLVRFLILQCRVPVIATGPNRIGLTESGFQALARVWADHKNRTFNYVRIPDSGQTSESELIAESR